MAKKQVNLKSGSAYIWIFSSPIESFIPPASGSLDQILASPRISPWLSSGGRAGSSEAVNGLNINQDIFQGFSSQPDQLPLVTEISPEQQMGEASLSVERDNFEIKSQISSRPSGYTSTGIDATLEISIADITLRNMALAFGYQDQIASNGSLGLPEKLYRLHLLDNAGYFLDKFDCLVIPAPSLFNLDPADGANIESQLIKWRNSWVYIPQASVVDARPNLVYGIEQQQEIKVSIRSTPDFRNSADKPYTSSSKDRVIFGYPEI